MKSVLNENRGLSPIIPIILSYYFMGPDCATLCFTDTFNGRQYYLLKELL